MKTLLKVVTLSFLLSLPVYVAGQEQDTGSARFSVSAGVDWYRSYSQKKTDLPMKMGYPVFAAIPFRIGAGVIVDANNWAHHFYLHGFHATTMKADDGLENNYLLNAGESSFSGATLEHRMQRTIMQYHRFALQIVPVAGLDYQHRNVSYQSGVRERTADINLYLGFRPVAQWQWAQQWLLQGGFDAMAYLPYLNTGTLTRWDAADTQIEQTQYRAFYYRTRLHAALQYRMNDYYAVRIGYRLNSTVGFANRQPLFYINELIHHRMERSHSVYVQYNF